MSSTAFDCGSVFFATKVDCTYLLFQPRHVHFDSDLFTYRYAFGKRFAFYPLPRVDFLNLHVAPILAAYFVEGVRDLTKG